MEFQTTPFQTTARYSHKGPHFLVAIMALGMCYALFLDTAHTELLCQGGMCVLTKASLASKRDASGKLRGVLGLGV